MRTFIGEQPDVSSQEGWESMRSGMANPNEQDVPEPGGSSRRQGLAGSVANIWWSDRANEEVMLQRMRPADLPHQESGSEAGVSVSARREVGQEDLHPPYEDVFAEAAREMGRQTSVTAYPQEAGVRFLREQSVLTPVSESRLRMERDTMGQGEGPGLRGMQSLEVGQDGATAMGPTSGNLQELSLEQIYEALDPSADNPLVREMRRRMEAAERLSSRQASEVTALEGVVDSHVVQSTRSDLDPGVQSAQQGWTAGTVVSRPQIIRNLESRALPPLPLSRSNAQAKALTASRAAYRDDSLEAISTMGVTLGVGPTLGSTQAPLQQLTGGGVLRRGDGMQPVESGFSVTAGFNAFEGFNAPIEHGTPVGFSGPWDSLGFRPGQGSSDPTGIRMTNPPHKV